MLNAPFNRPGRATSYNNWHSHRLKIVGEIAFAIGDTALVEFDRQRARNGEAAYKAGTLFDPKNGIPTLLLATYFDTDPELMPLARKLSGSEDRYPGLQAVVNALMGSDGK
jgi:hypothetical protein